MSVWTLYLAGLVPVILAVEAAVFGISWMHRFGVHGSDPDS